MTESNGNGNGHSGKYSAQQFIDAMPGTGGIISMIADVVGCNWHTAKKYITDFPTVQKAWEQERRRINDRAQHNIIKAIKGGDLQMSKWWLQVMEDEFVPREKREITGADGTALVVEFVNDWRHRAEQ